MTEFEPSIPSRSSAFGGRQLLVPFLSISGSSLASLAVFLIFTVYFLYPIPFHLGTRVIGRPFEDGFESIWYLHWYKHAIFDLKTSLFFQPDIFFPGGWDLRFAVMPPLFPILLSPLTALVGHVATYNLALMGSCIFAAYGAYRLSRALGANIWGGIVAGIAFAFYPNRQVYLGGFLNLLLGSMWLPWMLYGLFQAVRCPQRRTHWMVWAALGYALSIGGAWQFFIISTVTALVFGTFVLLPLVRMEWRRWVRPFVVALAVGGLVVAPLAWIGVMARERIGTNADFPLLNLEATGVSVERLLVPSALNPLVWNLARKTFPLTNGEDGIVNFGIAPIVLALLAVIWLRPRNSYLRGFLALVVVGLLLMPGPTLRFWGKPVSVHLPGASVAERIDPALVTPSRALKVPMPALVLYKLFPPFRSFHHFGRWGLLVSLGIGALAAVGLTEGSKRYSRRVQAGLGILCLLLLAVEFNTQPLPSVTSTQQMARSVDRWLAAQPEQSVIIEYPLQYTMKGQSLYYTISHWQKTVHGYSVIPPAAFSEMLPILNEWPNEPALDLLNQIGVRYILVHAFQGDDFENVNLPILQRIPCLRLIERFPTPIGPVRDIYLFELLQSGQGGRRFDKPAL